MSTPTGPAPTELSYDEHDGVGVVTLRRPEARNALTFTTYAELEEAVRTTTARCLVITGADPAFCSGDDVKQVMATAGDRVAEGLAAEPHLTPAADALLHTDVPVIAAVNGPAVGWGMELALMADLRVASERARFGELFVARGLCCDVAGLGRLAQLVGRERAAELLFTGRIIDADHPPPDPALPPCVAATPSPLSHRRGAYGLVSRVVAHDELMPTALALALAERIASMPPLAVQQIKQGLRRALDPDWRELGTWVSASLAQLFRTDDHREGVAAFLEKREPRFAGR